MTPADFQKKYLDKKLLLILLIQASILNLSEKIIFFISVNPLIIAKIEELINSDA